MRPVGVLAIGGDDMQVELGLRIVPTQHHAHARRQLGAIGLVELYALEDLAVGAADLDAVGAVAERIGADEAPGAVGIERERIAVDHQALGALGADQFAQVSFDQAAAALAAAIDGRSRIGDTRGIGLLEQAGIAPACRRTIQVHRRLG